MTTAIPVVNATPAGTSIATPATAAALSMSFPNDGKTVLIIKTGATTANLTEIATKVVPDGAIPGQALPGRTKALIANDFQHFGTFPPDVWNDTNGNMNFNLDAITNISVMCIRVAVSP